MKNDKFKTADEVLNERKIREREAIKKRIGNDFRDVVGNIFLQKEMKKVKRKFSILKWMGIILLILFMTTFILGLIFLLKFFIQGIF